MRASATSSETWSPKVTQDPKESSLTLTPDLPSLRYFIFAVTLARLCAYDEDVPENSFPSLINRPQSYASLVSAASLVHRETRYTRIDLGCAANGAQHTMLIGSCMPGTPEKPELLVTVQPVPEARSWAEKV